MRRNKLTVSLLLAAVVCALALARAAVEVSAQQQSSGGAIVTGRVLDPQGVPLAGASVKLYAREGSTPVAVRLATTTDEAGSYRFAELPPGEYILEVEATGFARARARVLRVERAGASLDIDVELEVAAVREEVVVTASDAPQTVDEVSKAVTVVGRVEMDERDEFLIPEALRTVPGLFVQQFGGPGSFTNIRTRGLRTQDTAVLIDGLRFRDPTSVHGDASGYLSDLVNTNNSRVEVLRGSGSSLYGTNAVGGVVNIVTDEGGGPFRGNLLAEGGGLGFFRGRAQFAGGAGDADRVAYSAGVSHLNVARGTDGDDAARNTSAQGRVSLRLAPTATLVARLYTSDSFVQLNENPLAVGTLPATGIVEARPLSESELRRYESGTAVGQLNVGSATFIPGANDPDNSRASRFFSGSLTFAHRPSEAFGYSVTYHGLRTRASFREGSSGAGDPTDFNNFFEPFGSTRNEFDGKTHTFNARTDFRLGRSHLITAGYEFERENYLNRSFDVTPSGNSSVSISERSHALFVQDQLRFLEGRLQLSAAFRAQFFHLSAPVFTPSAGSPFASAAFDSPPDAYTGDGSVSYFFRSTGTKLRAHVGNGYRAPSLFERFGTFFSTFTNSFSPLGDPRLAPDRSIAFDAGLDQTLADGRARLSATYFYTRLQEVVDFSNFIAGDPVRLFGGYVNTGGQLARGAELSATLAPTRTTDLFAAYTYTNSDQRRPQLPGVVRSLGIPDHQFALVATQRIGRRALLNFDLAATSDYLAPVFDNRTFQSRAFRFRGALRGDLGGSYTVTLNERRSLRLFGKVENIFDRDYFESGFRTPGASGRAGASLNF
jgi:iron complex outermembrane receptor protein